MALADFVEQNPVVRGTRCWLCYLPEAAEINAAKRNKTASVPQMIAWLVKECGYSEDDVRTPRINNHFQARHHIQWPDGRTA